MKRIWLEWPAGSLEALEFYHDSLSIHCSYKKTITKISASLSKYLYAYKCVFAQISGNVFE